jgi:hypothetical protein
MSLLLAPFFMPLVLIRWLFPEELERELDEQEAEREKQFGETWGVLYGGEGELREVREAEFEY